MKTPQRIAIIRSVLDARAAELPNSPRRLLRWVYGARLITAAAIFVAAAVVWKRVDSSETLLASLTFAAAMTVTAGSVFYTEVYRREVSPTFLYLQVVFDVLLVAAVVHVTWDASSSQFAPLYILVIAVAALLLAPRGVVLVAMMASVLYFAEAIWVQPGPLGATVVPQLVVFAAVALGSGYVGARLRRDGFGRDALVEELERFRLREADMERVHLRAERLEAVGELSASMAHEIRNPLASIRSAVEQLAARPRATEDERTLATLVQRESDRLSRLLSEFLDFARVDVGRTTRLDAGAIVRQVAELAGASPERPDGVRVRCALPAEPLLVEGDQDVLHRALFNLVLNAVQFSPEAGVVRIEGASLWPNQLAPHADRFARGAVALRVMDQGPGIAPEARDRIFDPFYTSRQGGTGLGLAIVHRAIEAHNGVVVVDSDRRGTRFTILLPKA